ncbi:hypothetical protein F4825DRAFT_453134 [Nemania diffusa]|nr:hypothetical protein F4825DRAFT_453134 [Nemania diffusa]
MDGSSSRFPSASVASSASPETGTSPFTFTPHPSIKELLPTGIDPPRPAKQGYEWVWFPAGYWAEREIVQTPTKDSTRGFRWRKRSGKSSSESPKHSSQAPRTTPHTTPHTTPSLSEEKTEKSPDHSAGRRSLSRATESSESGGSFFHLKRMADGPLPSPYLTEEAHVQSLQWPSIEAASRNRSISGSSVAGSRATHSPSHLSSTENEIEPVGHVPSMTRSGRQLVVGVTLEAAVPERLVLEIGPTAEEVKPKKSLMNWRILSERRLRSKRLQLPSSTVRKSSSGSEKSRTSLKRRTTKLFTRKKTSSLSSSPVRNRSPDPAVVSKKEVVAPKPTNSWTPDYPGGEAIRVQTPPILQNALDQFPRSFFSVLRPHSPPPHRPPLSRQDAHTAPKKTTLSTYFTPGESSTSSTPRATPQTDHRHSDTESSGHSVIRSVNDIGRRRLPTPSPVSTPISISTPISTHTTTTNSGSANKNASSSSSGGGGGGTTNVGSSSTTTESSSKRSSRKAWWDVPVSHGVGFASDQQRQQRQQQRAAAAFRFDMPEHLPSSPMCPANKRHKSGGTGVCVYHGRAAKGRGAKARAAEGVNGFVEGEGEEREYDTDETGSDVWK